MEHDLPRIWTKGQRGYCDGSQGVKACAVLPCVLYKQRRLYIIKRDKRIKKKAYELEEVKQREEEEDGDEEGATEKRM